MKTVKLVHGPYYRDADDRQHVIITYTDNSRRTVSYPKYLMEQHLGRELDPDKETIDHIDRDHTNNSISNLRVVDRTTHGKEDAIYRNEVIKPCAWCSKEFKLSANQLKSRTKLKAGPFCSRSCSGKYGKSVQLGGEVLARSSASEDVTYFLKDKS